MNYIYTPDVWSETIADVENGVYITDDRDETELRIEDDESEFEVTLSTIFDHEIFKEEREAALADVRFRLIAYAPRDALSKQALDVLPENE